DAVFGSAVVRCVCAQTAAPPTTAPDITTDSSLLIRSPFPDSSASFLDDALASVGCRPETQSRCELLPWRQHGKVRRLWVRRVKTPGQGRCSGHLRLLTVRTNGPGNLARAPVLSGDSVSRNSMGEKGSCRQ